MRFYQRFGCRNDPTIASAYPRSEDDLIAFLQLALPVQSQDVRLDCGYRIDILVENQLIVGLKSVEERGIHDAQLLTWMKLAGMKIGLLMNFNVTRLKDGIQRFVL